MITNISNAYIGDASISRIYQGDELVYVTGHPDIRLEWIANGPNGGAANPDVYFDTGFSPQLSTRAEVKCETPALDVARVFGCGNSAVSSMFNLNMYATGNTQEGGTKASLKFFYRGGNISASFTPVINTPYTISLFGTYSGNTASEINMIVDGVKYTRSIKVSTNITDAQSAYIFRWHGNVNEIPSGVKFYYVKIWEDNNLIRFYLPVLHWLNGQYVPCFYDKVNDTYIYNLGTDTPTYKISGDYLLDYIQNGPDSFSAVGVSYDTGLDSSVNLYYDVILRTPDASIWSGYRTLMGTGTVSGTDTGKAYSHQALYAYNSNYVIYNGVDTIGGNNINVNGNATFPIGDKVRISLNSLNNKLYAWFSNDSSTENLGGGYQDVPAAVPNGDFLLFGERQIDSTTTSYSYGGLRFYMLNFRYANNTPAKTYIPVLHNNQAAFLDLNSGTYIYNIGTSAPYYQFKR